MTACPFSRLPAPWNAPYLCESQNSNTDHAAEDVLATLVAEIEKCLGEDWSKDESRSSSVYAVLHSAQDPRHGTMAGTSSG